MRQRIGKAPELLPPLLRFLRPSVVKRKFQSERCPQIRGVNLAEVRSRLYSANERVEKGGYMDPSSGLASSPSRGWVFICSVVTA